jgi:succinoglycan biosynthesis protein ExoU
MRGRSILLPDHPSQPSYDGSDDDRQRLQVLAELPEPAVDVLIAAWDRSETIQRAVMSALAQPDVSTVIVVDDGSRDDTASRARECAVDSSRLVVERLPANRGPSAARNLALEISTASWVTMLDGDDYLLPGRIAALLAKAEAWDFVADDLLQVRDSADEPMRPALFERHFDPWPLSFEQFVRGNVTRRPLRRELGFLKPLIRRSFLERHRLRYDERLRLGEDYALYARALAAGARFLLVPAEGYVSVMRNDSISSCHSREDLERLRDSDTDLIAQNSLTAGERRALKSRYQSVDCRVQWLVAIEAVKSREFARFMATFGRSPKVSLFLVERLLEELFKRARRAKAG